MGFLIRNLQTCKLQLSVLRVFKIHEITPTVEFLSSEPGPEAATKTSQEGLPVYLEKDFLMDVLLHKKLQKTKINTSKGKINFLQCQRRRQCRCLYIGTKIQVQEIECAHYSKNFKAFKLLNSIHICFF